MTVNPEQRLDHLRQFLRSIQKPNKPIDSVGIDENLVSSGLIDSLAIVQIVVYLEDTYGIDFSSRGLDPDRLASMANILALITDSDATPTTMP